MVATVWMVFNPRGVVVDEAIADEAEPGIAVLPFSARGEGMEVWREGMVDLLSTNLDAVPGLRSIDSRTLFARWREAVPESGEVDQATALRIARATGAKYALLGSAVSLGGEVRLSAEVYEIEGGGRMGQAQVQGSPDSILSLVDRLAVQSLVVALQQVESELPEIDVASVTTSSLPALRAWLEGEVHYRHGAVSAAVAAYERALAHDSTFAFACYRLSAVYAWAESVSSSRVEEAIQHARRFVDRLPPRQATLVRGLEARERGDLGEANSILRRLVRSYPDYADAWYELGEFYYHWGTRIPASIDDAWDCFSRAVELDPSFATYRIHPIEFALNYDPDSTRVANLLAEYKQLASADDVQTRELQVAFDLVFGDEERRQRTLAALDTLDPWILHMLPQNRLRHPRFWPQYEAAYLAKERRQSRDYWYELFWGAAGGRGYAESGFAYLDRPQTNTVTRACHTFLWHQQGFPLSENRLAETEILTSNIDSLRASGHLYCAGAKAADEGLWDKHAQAIETLEESARRSVAAGGTGRTAARTALAVEAYGLWKQGRPEAALAVLSDLRRYEAARIVSWVLGMILIDLERWEEAIPYLRNWWWDTYSFMNYNLARAYEHTGEYDKARKEYAFFVEAWQDADPELQPWVDDARRALDRLRPDS
ncbi:MAG: hypothetical protein AMS21_11895 [Gemmatimonas sp. SG8_38_2]|nr:MAG: hypothetical protein AMS21_11895 [Gemmatimonas sp. SG8_38_2]